MSTDSLNSSRTITEGSSDTESEIDSEVDLEKGGWIFTHHKHHETNSTAAAEKVRQQNQQLDTTSSDFDQQLLSRCLHDTGRWAFGSVVAEVWLLTENRDALVQPEEGCWVDPAFHSNNCGEYCHICRVTKASHPEYIPPDPVMLGEGLPGILWAEDVSTRRGPLVWRDVDALAKDPQKPWNPRLNQLTCAGLGWAAGLPLYHEGEKQGIVIYMARRNVDLSRLRSQTNEDYLRAATTLIAASVGLRKPRKKVIQERKQELARSIRIVRAKMMTIVCFGQSLQKLVKENHHDEDSTTMKSNNRWKSMTSSLSKRWSDSPDFRVAFETSFRNAKQYFHQRFITTIKKCEGGKVRPPPPFNWVQTIHSFIGVFVTFVILTYMNRALTITNSGNSPLLVLGPFGALTTLLYGLTAAPAAQPLNAIGGQVISVAIVLGMRQFDFQEEFRISLSIALAVAAMVKLGLTHPPAGASAVIFASSQLWGWSHLLILVVGNLITVLVASFINNWSNQRQYPTYWGLSGIQEHIYQIWTMLSRSCWKTSSPEPQGENSASYLKNRSTKKNGKVYHYNTFE